MPQQEVIKILLIDDDKEDYLITRDVISDIRDKKYSIDWISNYKEGLEAIDKAEHDAYLIDYRLGANTGLEVIKEAIKNGCVAPLILLTGQNDIEIDMEAMKVGASDYLVKSAINPLLLERSIRYSMAQVKVLRQLSELNADLEQRVEKRTSELVLANKKLEESKEEIRRAFEKERDLNELKSRFVSMASHEFRTPLSTILSSITLVENYNDPSQAEKRAKHIARIKTSVKNLTDILNDLLSLGKIEEGKVQAVAVKFDMKKFAEELTEEMQAVAKDGQVIKYTHTGSTDEACLDKNLLKNIVINLLNNAIKYSPEGKDILFYTRITDKDTSVSVKDNGMGIPDEDKVHLFDRFFRAHNASNIAGTGLGLNIVKKYLDLMGGTIEFQSELNKGSTFTVNFPG